MVVTSEQMNEYNRLNELVNRYNQALSSPNITGRDRYQLEQARSSALSQIQDLQRSEHKPVSPSIGSGYTPSYTTSPSSPSNNDYTTVTQTQSLFSPNITTIEDAQTKEVKVEKTFKPTATPPLVTTYVPGVKESFLAPQSGVDYHFGETLEFKNTVTTTVTPKGGEPYGVFTTGEALGLKKNKAFSQYAYELAYGLTPSFIGGKEFKERMGSNVKSVAQGFGSNLGIINELITGIGTSIRKGGEIIGLTPRYEYIESPGTTALKEFFEIGIYTPTDTRYMTEQTRFVNELVGSMLGSEVISKGFNIVTNAYEKSKIVNPLDVKSTFDIRKNDKSNLYNINVKSKITYPGDKVIYVEDAGLITKPTVIKGMPYSKVTSTSVGTGETTVSLLSKTKKIPMGYYNSFISKGGNYQIGGVYSFKGEGITPLISTSYAELSIPGTLTGIDYVPINAIGLDFTKNVKNLIKGGDNIYNYGSSANAISKTETTSISKTLIGEINKIIGTQIEKTKYVPNTISIDKSLSLGLGIIGGVKTTIKDETKSISKTSPTTTTITDVVIRDLIKAPTIPITKTITRQKSMIGSKEKTYTETTLISKPITNQESKIGISTAIKSLIGTRTGTNIGVSNISSITPYPEYPNVKTPKIDINFGIDFSLPKGGISSKEKVNIFGKRTSPTKYTPSFSAVVLGIRGKQPKQSLFSGGEIRPLPNLAKVIKIKKVKSVKSNIGMNLNKLFGLKTKKKTKKR